LNGLEKPPPALRFFSPPASESPSTSLSSEPRTRFSLFFLAGFALALGLPFLAAAAPPPRVCGPRARDNLFSCAWSSAANLASASSSDTLSRFCFFLAGGEVETLISPSAASPFRSASSDEVVRLGSGEGSFSSTAVPEGGVGMAWAASEEMASNRASIRLLIAFYAAEDRLVTTRPHYRVHG